MTATGRGLSAAQVAQFQGEGYLLVERLLEPAELQPLIEEISSEVDRLASELHAAGVLSATYAEEGFTTRLTRLTAETDQVYWRIASGQLCGPQVFELLRHPKILDVAEALLGPEIVAASAYRLRPKVPGFAHGVVPWHQDSGYFEPACDNALILTVWMPLVDATAENGCLWVIPASHHGPVVPHRQARQYLEIPSEHLDLGHAVCVPVPRGGALLLGNRTAHCSTDNTTDTIRWSFDLRYQGLNAPSPALPADLRAEARAAVRELTALPDLPLSCYAPEPDCLVRSARHPEAVIADWESFHRLRTTHQPGPSPRRWA
ncbi:MAG: phytanoyl-CoA dioxygenase family protein [Fimbriimonadaceae bacterium]|nr:phytanoyl-CoA dioxygenase family protein [Fimbriimonadaceae bacterium]